MSRLLDKILESKLTPEEDAKYVAFGAKLYAEDSNSNKWNEFNTAYEIADKEAMNKLMQEKKGRWRAEKGGEYYRVMLAIDELIKSL